MRHLAQIEPVFELGQENEFQFRGYDVAGRHAANKQAILYDATSEAACNRANFGNVDLDADPLAGNYATFVHCRALRRVAGDTEAVAAREAARARYACPGRWPAVPHASRAFWAAPRPQRRPTRSSSRPRHRR
jgi:hypothetical protein